MMNYMILQDDASKFYDILMPYLAHGPITDSILSLLFVYDNNEESRTKRQSSLEMLSNHGFLQWFLDAIQLAGMYQERPFAPKVHLIDILFIKINRTSRTLPRTCF